MQADDESIAPSYRPVMVRFSPDLDQALQELPLRGDYRPISGIIRTALREYLDLAPQPEKTTARPPARTPSEVKSRYRKTFVQLTPDVDEAVRQRALAEDRPLAGIVRQALREHLKLDKAS